MKRWKKVVIWVASIVVVLGIGGLFAANYAVDKVLNSMVGMSVDDILGEADESSTSEEPTTQEGASGNAQTEENDEAGTDNGEAVEETTAPVSENNSDNGNAQSSNSDNGKQTDSGKSDSGYSAAISTDKAKEVEENITVAEKAKVVTTLLGALSASDISTLQSLAGGGLSVEDKKQAKELLLEKLTEDQYNELIAIAAKHGLSQGKTYSETK